MSLQIEYTYDEDFAKQIEWTDEALLKIWGISSEYLDLNRFLPRFINTEVVGDASVDSNSNVEGKTVASVLQEFSKPAMKLNNLYLIWDKAKEVYGEQRADEILNAILTGVLYPNDLFLFAYVPYCWNYSPIDVALKGLPFIPRVPSKPPKHSDSFLQQIIQLLMFGSNHQSGATGIAGLIPVWSAYLKKENASDEKITQQFQWLLYSFGQPVRYSYQSLFVNMTIFDKPSMEYLYGNVYIPAIDAKIDIDYAMDVQKKCIEFLIDEMNRTGLVFTFPVLTVNISVDKDTQEPLDEEFFKWATDINSKYGIFNFFFTDVDVHNGHKDFALASCCFSGDTEVYIYEGDKKVKVRFDGLEQGRLYEVDAYRKADYGMMKYDKKAQAKLVVVKGDIYLTELIVGREGEKQVIYATEDHIFPVWFGNDKEVCVGETDVAHLSVGDSLREFGKYVDREWEILSIKRKVKRADKVYCFEIQNASPYFLLGNGIITHNCRLTNRESIINTTFGAGGEKIGAVGSVVINLPRIGYISNNEKDYFKNLEKALSLAQDTVFLRRLFVEKRIKQGLLPLYTHGFMDLSKQFLIIGINGMYESAEAMNIPLSRYPVFAQRVLHMINYLNKIKAKELKEKGYEVSFAIEQVPAENLAIKLADLDRALGYQDKYELYSNQWTPLTEDVDFFERIEIAGQLDRMCTGGAIVHLNVNHPISGDMQRRILKHAYKKGVIYCAFNYDLSRCNNCNTITPSKVSVCPICGSTDIDYFYRVVGFITNVRKSWSEPRRREYDKRVRYSVKRG